jgi:hypothetical protein
MIWMDKSNRRRYGQRRLDASERALRLGLILAAALGWMGGGCNSSSPGGTSTNPAPNPQGAAKLYFAPTIGDVYAATYSIDHTANTFTRKVFGFNNSPADGGTITDSGVVATLSNGIVSLETTYNESDAGVVTTYNPPLAGSWAVEIPGEAALVGMKDYSTFTPAVPTGSCPSLSTAQNFQFVTIPNHLGTGTSIVANNWNPQLETAFGFAQISTSGTSVEFNNVKQFMLPASGKPPSAPSNPGPSQANALCAPTYYGQTIGVPNTVTVIDPGTQENVPPSATIGIGPSGFLAEDAGASQIQGEPYENILGAGYGAIGLATPSSALDTSALAAAQFQGFVYGSGGPASGSQSGAGFSLIGSFGYSNLSTACLKLPAPKSSTTIFGGEFANNDPSAHAFGNCDLAIDLGSQDSSNNGVYPAATVYVGDSFPMNGIGEAYSFKAVAIAGQISGKYAIFVLGADTVGLPNQGWGIYLLQSH